MTENNSLHGGARVTYHVNRSTFESHLIPSQQFESEEQIFTWNCLKNREFREGDLD